MNIRQRIFLSLKSQPLRTTMLFLIFTISFLMILLTIKIQNAAIGVSDNLMHNFPPVASVSAISPFEDIIEYHKNFPSLATFEKISDLDGVLAHDLTIFATVTTRNLSKVFSPTLTEAQEQLLNRNQIINNTPVPREEFISFDLHGVSEGNLIDQQTGLISLISGNTFSQSEIDNGSPVAIISSTFASENNLDLYSTFTLESLVFDFRKLGDNWWRGIPSEDNIYWSKSLELTVIGIFEITTEFDYLNDEMGASIADFTLQNRIFLPNRLVEEIRYQTLTNFVSVTPHQQSQDVLISRNIFLLENFDYMESFIQSANALLNYPFEMLDLSISMEHLIATQQNINDIFFLLTLLIIGATIIAIGIILIYSVINRRREIAIYTALGERRKNLIIQIFSEIFIIVLFSFIVSYTISVLFSGILNQNLYEVFLRNEPTITGQMVGNRIRASIPQTLAFFVGGSQSQIPLDFATQHFIVSPSFQIILRLLAILGAVVTTTLIAPLIFLMRVDPKRLLLD